MFYVPKNLSVHTYLFTRDRVQSNKTDIQTETGTNTHTGTDYVLSSSHRIRRSDMSYWFDVNYVLASDSIPILDMIHCEWFNKMPR